MHPIIPDEVMDYDEEELEPVSKVRPLRKQSQQLAPAHPAIAIAQSVAATARRVPARIWLMSGVFTVMSILMWSQMKPAQDPVRLADPNDRRAIPAFNEAELLKENLGQIDAHERNITAFLNEERQRSTVALAMAYRGIAVGYMQTPSHLCQGKSELNCLKTFTGNRIANLRSLSEGKAKESKQGANAILGAILDRASERERVEGLRLAQILATPQNARQKWQQDYIDSFFPILNAAIPPEELASRPGVLSQLLERSDELQETMLSGSQESTIRVQRCLALPPEQQPAGGCK